MRVSKSIGLGLAVLLLTQTISACTYLRTPYEKAKINENGGTVKAPEDQQVGSDRGGGNKGGKNKGGGKKEKADPGKFKVYPTRAETINQKKAREKQGGALFTSPYSQDTERKKAQEEQQKKQPQKSKALEQSTQQFTQRMSYSKGLSAEVSKVEDVDSGTVLIDRDHNAYVAINSDTKTNSYEPMATQVNRTLNIKSKGEVPEDTQRKIAERLRASDPKISTVYITNDPSHVKTFQRYVQEASSGHLSEMSSEALIEHIEDIWKK